MKRGGRKYQIPNLVFLMKKNRKAYFMIRKLFPKRKIKPTVLHRVELSLTPSK